MALDNADGVTYSYVNFTCLEFTLKTYDIVFTTKIPLCSCAIIVNLAAIVFVFIAKRHADFFYRLMVYLMITDVLQAMAVIFISLPVRVLQDGVVHVRSEGGCRASGYFSMSTVWTGNIIFFWISLHLAYRGWCLYRHVDKGRDQDDKMESVKSKDVRGSRKYPIKEIVGVLILFVAPFAIASIPFAVEQHHGGSYGLSGLWCRIKAFNDYCGDLGYDLLILLLLFFYGPLMIIVLFAFIFTIVAFCCYCCGEVRKIDKDKEKKERYIKEILILLPLPLVYWTACMFFLTTRISSIVHDDKPPDEKLWIVHAIADSLRSMLPALAFLLHPCVWKDKVVCLSKKSNHKPETDRIGINYSSQESLAPGNKVYYGSNIFSDIASVVFDN